MPPVVAIRYRDRPDPAAPSPGHPLEFTLRYRGLLPSASQSDPRTKIKQHIRRKLNIQLAELWHMQLTLVRFRDKLAKLEFPPNRKELRLGRYHSLKKVGDFWWLPLVSRESYCTCEVSVVFLRHGYPGEVITPSGDLDNRLKTLFDGLRMPQNEAELAGDAPRASGSPLMFCLLEDDGLITKVSIEAKRLLGRRSQRARNEVELSIDVLVKANSLAFRQVVEMG